MRHFVSRLLAVLVLVCASGMGLAATPPQDALRRAIGPESWVYPLADYIEGKTGGASSIMDSAFNAKGNGTSDDSAAFTAACAAVIASGNRSLIVPRGSYNVATLSPEACANVTFLGQGVLVNSYRKWVFDPSLGSPPLPGPTITAGNLRTSSAATSPVYVIVGDSTCGDYPGPNTRASTEYIYPTIVAKIRRDTVGRNVTIINRCVPGQTWSSAHSIAGSNWPAWYLDHGALWLATYVQPLAPDTVIFAFGVNDGAAPSSTANAGANLRATVAIVNSWAKIPDIILATNLQVSTAAVGLNTQALQEQREWVSGYERSYAAKNGYGFLDFGRRMDIARDGFDPVNQAQVCPEPTCASVTIAPGAWPFVAPTSTRDFSVNLRTTGSAATFWSALTSMTFTLSQDPTNTLVLTNNGGFIAYTVNADASAVSLPTTTTAIPVTQDDGSGNVLMNIAVRTDPSGSHLVVSYGAAVANTILIDALIEHAGGLFTPQVSIVGTVPTNVFANLTVGQPRLYVPSISDAEVYGTTAGTQPWGGNGTNHIASRGAQVILEPVVEANYFGASGSGSGGTVADNKIINGEMRLDQPHEGANQVFNAAAGICMDRWRYNQSTLTSRYFCARQTASPPAGTGHYLTITETGGIVAPGAGANAIVSQNIEGPDIEDLGWGGAGASSVVTGFWALANNSGAYAVALQNTAATRAFVHEYTLVAGVWTYISFVVPGDITGTWSTLPGSAGGMKLLFPVGCGTTYQTTTLDAWQINGFLCTASTVQMSNVAAASLSITGVKITKGTTDSAVAPRPIAQTIALAQRYYNKTFSIGTAPAQNAGLAGSFCVRNPIAVGDPSGFLQAPVKMAGIPTVTTFNPSAANANWRDVTAAADVTVSVDPATAIGTNGALIATGATVATLGDLLCIHATMDVGF